MLIVKHQTPERHRFSSEKFTEAEKNGLETTSHLCLTNLMFKFYFLLIFRNPQCLSVVAEKVKAPLKKKSSGYFSLPLGSESVFYGKAKLAHATACKMT